MKLQIECLDKTQRQFTATFSAQEVAPLYQQSIQRLKMKIKLPGFRPGKIPTDLIEKRFSRELEEHFQRLIRRAVLEEFNKQSEDDFFILKKEGITPFVPEKDLRAEFTVEVYPCCELPDYKTFKLTKAAIEVTEQEVEELLLRLRKSRAEYSPVARAARKGDYVKLSYAGSYGGIALKESVPLLPKIWLSQENTWEEVGNTNSPCVPEIVTALEGKKSGDKENLIVSFDKDFSIAELAGKNINYEIEVKEVREIHLPEIDKAFLKNFNVSTIEDLRVHLTEELKRQKQVVQRQKDIQETFQWLKKETKIEVPSAAIEEKKSFFLEELVRAASQKGISREEMEKEKEFFFKTAEERAKETLIINRLLDVIARKEKIELLKEELTKLVLHEACKRGLKPEKLVKDLKQKPFQRIELVQEGIRAKTVDFLLSIATIERN